MLLTTRTRAYPFSKDVWGLYGICKRKAVINVAKIKKEIIVEDVLVFLVRINPEKPDVPLNKNDAFQKVQKRRVQEKR